MSTEFANIELTLIVRSLTNPRKHFNPTKLTELAASIKTSGVHQPILVRPLPGSRVEETSWNSEYGQQLTRRAVLPAYEIVAGERRYRASQEAGVHTIPAMIRELTDEQVLEIQIVENLQRDDLTELEEAEGYEALMAHSQITADTVAEKIGKSRSYVFGRLKLLDLSQDSKQALRDGQIDASRALLIARIPDSALQAKALAEATRKDYQGEVPSVRSLQTWLKANVMLRLDQATFKITDTRLVKGAGNCKDCPKRTGANPDLFADVDGADICTDPMCFHSKEDAHRTAMVTQAEKNGMRLIDGKEARQICQSNRLDGYLPLSQVREDAAHMIGSMARGMRAPTLRDLLGKDAPSPVLIENPYTKELIEAVPTEEAEALLLVRGLIKTTQAQATKQDDLQTEIEHLQEGMKKRIARETHTAQYTAVIDGIRAEPESQVIKLLTGDVLREWLQAKLASSIEAEEMAAMLNYTFDDGADEVDALGMHIRATSTANLLRALLIYMAMEDRPYVGFALQPPNSTILKAMAAAVQIDTSAIEKSVASAVKAEVAQEVKQIKAQLKAATTAAPVSTAETSSQGEGGEPKTKTTKATTRKPKISAEEATLGIAAAMQGLDGAASAPEGAVALPAEPAGESAGQMIGLCLANGTAVKAMAGKCKGKEGVILKDLGDDCYTVKLKGVGAALSYRLDQLEVVQVAA